MWFVKLDRKQEEHEGIMKFLVVGLGNIGDPYRDTRHNIGFSVLDEIIKDAQLTAETKRYGSVAHWKFKGRTLVLVKPSTYMNLSGKAVNYWMQQEKIPRENLLVIADDLSLPFGKIRIRSKGGDGGHNGLNHIIETLGHNEFARLRFGIGSDFSKGHQVDFVLSPWSEEERTSLPPRIQVAVQSIQSFVTIGIGQTMTAFNK